MTLPHPHLIVLRSTATVMLSLIIGQAGFAAAFLGGGPQYFPVHATLGLVTLVVCLLGAVVYLVLRRTAGPVLIGLAVVIAAMTVLQVVLGETGVKDWHIFCGVLTAMMATALTSWTYRHPAPDAPPRVD